MLALVKQLSRWSIKILFFVISCVLQKIYYFNTISTKKMIMIRKFLNLTLACFLFSSSWGYADVVASKSEQPKPLTTNNDKNNISEQILTGQVLKPDTPVDNSLNTKSIKIVNDNDSIIEKKNFNPFVINEALREEKIKELKKRQIERRLKLGVPITPVVAKTEEELKKENENKILEAINLAKIESKNKKEKELAAKISDPTLTRYIGLINNKKMYQDLTTNEYFSVE